MATPQGPRRKLIEVALPLDAINREAAREKSIRHGHPSTLHLWWARRPLAACRAVLFAQLVDDPSSHPERFPTEAEQDVERKRLFDIIERLVPWEASNDEVILGEAREEIRRSCGGHLPVVLDPFCGGGSIPLEAQRLGLEAHASDLNPVAVLITKALVELPARFADQPPVRPAGREHRLDVRTWPGAQGLAEDVRYYGTWMRDEAKRRIGRLYPPVLLQGGGQATVIAWIWARTVTCPNPACRARMPLVRSFWLGKKKGREAWVEPIVEGTSVSFTISHSPKGPNIDGTVGRNGAKCLVCGSPVTLEHVRAEAQAGRMNVHLVAMVADGDRGRTYLPSTPEQQAAAQVPRPQDVPQEEVTTPSHDVDRLPMYGMRRWSDAFSNRQLTAVTTFVELVREARKCLISDGADSAYADVVVTYLGLAWDRIIDSHTTLTRWKSSMDQSIGLFSRQAISMVWDYAEVNPFAGAAGDLEVSLQSICRVLAKLPAANSAVVVQDDVGGISIEPSVVATDPPYYDNVGYANISDFFYVWLRRALAEVYPELFSTLLTPKAAELVADLTRTDGDKEKARDFFKKGFEHAFARLRAVADSGLPSDALLCL